MSPSESNRARPRLWLIRHGETQWSRSGRHTGRTDVPLTGRGREEARGLRPQLAGQRFARVVSSPLQRAAETCRLAGFDEDAVDYWDDLMEWDYGDYEGRSTADIRHDVPDWMIWEAGVPNGETLEQLGQRADRVLARLADDDGDIALFGHGHFSRALGVRWLGLPTQASRLLALDTASVSVLGYEHGLQVISRWNQTR
ncbi:MAG: histidine phosphatase family protein [Gammaproteobacteria bacterium]